MPLPVMTDFGWFRPNEGEDLSAALNRAMNTFRLGSHDGFVDGVEARAERTAAGVCQDITDAELSAYRATGYGEVLA